MDLPAYMYVKWEVLNGSASADIPLMFVLSTTDIVLGKVRRAFILYLTIFVGKMLVYPSIIYPTTVMYSRISFYLLYEFHFYLVFV